MQVLVMMGSNIEPETNVPVGMAALAHHADLHLISTSPTYVTPAIGPDGQPSGQADFHNAAALIETDLAPSALIRTLRTIETTMGRVRNGDKFAPRPLDLDIAMVADRILDFDGRHLPDPDILRFPHMALPLAAIAPNWVHPEAGTTLSQIAQGLHPKESEIHQL